MPFTNSFSALLLFDPALTRQGVNPVALRYFLATVLFGKGQTSRGIQGWYEIAAVSQADVKWDISYSQARSICHLAALCLRDANTFTSFEIDSKHGVCYI